jgi:hypothetical protein
MRTVLFRAGLARGPAAADMGAVPDVEVRDVAELRLALRRLLDGKGAPPS